MRPLVKSPVVGAAGALGTIVIALLLLRGDLTLAESAERAGILFLLVVVVERVLLPVARLLVGEPAPAEEEPAPDRG